MPSFPPNLTEIVIDDIPQLSHFSEVDLLMKEEIKQSKLEVVKQIAECLKLENGQSLQFVKERLEVAREICLTSSKYENNFLEMVKFEPFNDDNSLDQLLDGWVMFMRYHIEKMFNKNEESKLVLPSSLTSLEISSRSITSDALSTCIQCLVLLSKLKLYDIQTITSLPPKQVLCSLKNLESLSIEGCYLLCSLGGIGALTSLTALELNGCLNLKASNESLLSSMKTLKFCDCSNVDVIIAKSKLPVLNSLEVVNIIMFKNQRGVLCVGHLSSLEDLIIEELDGHLDGLHSLTELCKLHLRHCPGMNPSSPMDKYVCALEEVVVDNPLQLKLMISNETISTIEVLSIYSFQGDSAEDEVFCSLTSLNDLSINGFNSTHLPKNMKNLASLQYVTLVECSNLCEFEERPRNFRELIITDCPILAKKFNKDGPYRVLSYEGCTMVTFPTEGNLILRIEIPQ